VNNAMPLSEDAASSGAEMYVSQNRTGTAPSQRCCGVQGRAHTLLSAGRRPQQTAGFWENSDL